MVIINKIYADEVIDSRGNPTVRVNISLSDGSFADAIVPSGASTGDKEAVELRDGDKSRYHGKGVLKACANVNEMAHSLIGESPFDQGLIDGILKNLDGTNNYSKMGANAVLGISMAVSRVSAISQRIPLYKYIGGSNAITIPVPMCNIINGGSHANNSVDFQEYMVVPLKFDTFREAIRAVSEVYNHLKQIISDMNQSTSLGDEGGFAPNCKNNTEPLELITKAIELAGYKAGEDISIAMDCASSEFYKDGKYHLASENKIISADELVDMYEKMISKYPIFSIEDGLDEYDNAGWQTMTKKLGDKVQLVGDDLFVTNYDIFKDGIENNMANSILIKPNQIGSVSETMKTVRLAQRSGYTSVMSHRSGESEDTFIADFAVALNTGQIKTGSTARSDRTAKYNRLLQIENELENSEYLGSKIITR